MPFVLSIGTAFLMHCGVKSSMRASGDIRNLGRVAILDLLVEAGMQS
ncbi:MAG: hypothetical protein IPI14_10470 [Polaromonas sp.]|nr:hypothetical protein [Polaromonas sp.]